MWHKCLENFFFLAFGIMNGLRKKSSKLWKKNEFIPIHMSGFKALPKLQYTQLLETRGSMRGLTNECLKGKAMERMRGRKNTEPLSPKKDKEPELPAAVIPDTVCDWYENAGASGLEKELPWSQRSPGTTAVKLGWRWQRDEVQGQWCRAYQLWHGLVYKNNPRDNCGSFLAKPGLFFQGWESRCSRHTVGNLLIKLLSIFECVLRVWLGWVGWAGSALA